MYIRSIMILLIHCSLILNCGNPQELQNSNGYSEDEKYKLPLRVHLMGDITMTHTSGVVMDTWVTGNLFQKPLLPEINKIWSAAGIQFQIESIIDEPVIKPENYGELLEVVINAKRDKNGKADRARLGPLFEMMDPTHRSAEKETYGPLFHIYLFPFIGNTSQGNAMRLYGYHTVVGVWSNKHNGGGAPNKVLLTEPWERFRRGSLARTIAHEMGHVLGLSHKQCETDCLMGGTVSNGYFLTKDQINTARKVASSRLGRSK